MISTKESSSHIGKFDLFRTSKEVSNVALDHVCSYVVLFRALNVEIRDCSHGIKRTGLGFMCFVCLSAFSNKFLSKHFAHTVTIP